VPGAETREEMELALRYYRLLKRSVEPAPRLITPRILYEQSL